MASRPMANAGKPEADQARRRTQRLYDRLSGTYDTMADASEHDAREAGLGLLAPVAGDALLEIGCGTGRALGVLAQAADPTGRVVGLDLSRGMLAVARRHLEEERPAKAAPLVQADGALLPFGASVFDGVFLCFTLELFPVWRIPAVVREAARVLRPQGRLAVVSLLRTRPAPPAVRAYDWFRRHFPHLVDCQPIDVPELLGRGGLAVGRSRELRIWGLPAMAAVARKA